MCWKRARRLPQRVSVKLSVMIDPQVTIEAPRREPPAYGGLTVVIPTRNRANLAQAAIKSVLDEGLSQVTILVSDNSTDDAGARALQAHCEALDPRLVRYIRRALEPTGSSHFLYLTDRMVFKPGALGALVERARHFPDKVISYNTDRID